MDTYTVKAGDTLSAIVQRYYGNLDRLREVAAYNGIQNFNYLQIGQVLKLPPRLAEVEITATRIGTEAKPVSDTESFYSYDEQGNRYLRVPIRSGTPTAQASFSPPAWVWWVVGGIAVYWLLNQRRQR